MFQPNKFRTFARATKIFLMLLLIGFELVPGLAGGDMAYINQASSQLSRSQIIVNAAYTLVYRPEVEHAQALHDLQNVLPPFEREQTLLLTNMATDVQGLLQQARLDYLPLLAAAQIMIAHPDAADNSVELPIIVVHEHNYVITINLLLLVLPRSFSDRNIQLFIIQLVIQAVFVTLFLLALATFAWEEHVQTGKKTQLLTLKMLISKKAIFVFSLLFMLLGLEVVPLGVGNDAAYFNQATLQQTRCEVFARSAFALAYRPAEEKTSALSDIQFVLPLFQQEHAMLLANAAVRPLLQQTASEYQTMITAVQALSRYSGKPVDPTIIDTIVSQAPQCLADADRVVLTLQNTIQQRTSLIFYGEVAIEGIYIIFFASLLFLSHDPFAPAPKAEQALTA